MEISSLSVQAISMYDAEAGLWLKYWGFGRYVYVIIMNLVKLLGSVMEYSWQKICQTRSGTCGSLRRRRAHIDPRILISNDHNLQLLQSTRDAHSGNKRTFRLAVRFGPGYPHSGDNLDRAVPKPDRRTRITIRSLNRWKITRQP